MSDPVAGQPHLGCGARPGTAQTTGTDTHVNSWGQNHLHLHCAGGPRHGWTGPGSTECTTVLLSVPQHYWSYLSNTGRTAVLLGVYRSTVHTTVLLYYHSTTRRTTVLLYFHGATILPQYFTTIVRLYYHSTAVQPQYYFTTKVMLGIPQYYWA